MTTSRQLCDEHKMAAVKRDSVAKFRDQSESYTFVFTINCENYIFYHVIIFLFQKKSAPMNICSKIYLCLWRFVPKHNCAKGHCWNKWFMEQMSIDIIIVWNKCRLAQIFYGIKVSCNRSISEKTTILIQYCFTE